MELRHLRYFIEVALEENVTRAAEKLHVSQPALSRQVRDLEEELGFDLFARSAKSVALTEAGRVFLEEASAVVERLEQGVASARAVAGGASGEVRIGYAPSLTARILPPAIRGFQAEFPKVKVKLHDLTSEEMLDGLRTGRLDFAFLLERQTNGRSNLNFEPLKRERVRLAVGVAHEFAGSKGVPASQLARENLIGYSTKGYPEYGDMLEEILELGGIGRHLEEEHESVSSLIAAVEAGLGVAVVTESLRCVSSGRVVLVPIKPEPRPLVVGIAWRKRELSLKEKGFLQKALEACEGEE